MSSSSIFLRLAISDSTTEGSASVEVSPRSPSSFVAILRRIRHMMFPERVLSRPSVHWM